mgnify:CR=1 FL=1
MSDLLRPETLAAMRSATSRARPDLAAIKRAPTDRTFDGWDPRQAIAFHTVSCMVLPPSRGRSDASDGRSMTVTPLRLALPQGTDIQVRDYVQVADRLFQVTSLVNGSSGWEAQRLVEVEEIQ